MPTEAYRHIIPMGRALDEWRGVARGFHSVASVLVAASGWIPGAGRRQEG